MRESGFSCFSQTALTAAADIHPTSTMATNGRGSEPEGDCLASAWPGRRRRRRVKREAAMQEDGDFNQMAAIFYARALRCRLNALFRWLR